MADSVRLQTQKSQPTCKTEVSLGTSVVGESNISNVIDVLLERPVAVHRAFVAMAGDVNAGVMLSQAWYWSKKTNFDWFWKTQDEWLKETGLGRREQETARKSLNKRRIIEEQLRGVPAKMHFRVLRCRVEDLLVTLGKSTDWRKAPNLSAEFVSGDHSDWRKAPNLYGGNVQTSMAESAKPYKEAESTSESTSENIKPFPAKKSGDPVDTNNDRKQFTLTHQEVDTLSLQYRLTKHICEWYERENQMKCAWGKKEAGMLANVIKRHSSNPEGILFKCVDNRFKSDFMPSLEPADWIHKLLNYKNGPLDEYGKLRQVRTSYQDNDESLTEQMKRTGLLRDRRGE